MNSEASAVIVSTVGVVVTVGVGLGMAVGIDVPVAKGNFSKGVFIDDTIMGAAFCDAHEVKSDATIPNKQSA